MSFKIVIAISVVLIMVVGFVPPLQAAVQDVINTDAELQANIIASTVNILRASPDGTTVRLQLPDTTCNVVIEGTLLTYTTENNGRESKLVRNTIENPTGIGRIEAQCPQALSLKKDIGRITVV